MALVGAAQRVINFWVGRRGGLSAMQVSDGFCDLAQSQTDQAELVQVLWILRSLPDSFEERLPGRRQFASVMQNLGQLEICGGIGGG